MSLRFLRLLGLAIGVLVCGASAGLSQENVRRPLSVYEKLYGQLAQLKPNEAPIDTEKQFLPNWLIKTPGQEGIAITLAAGKDAVGVRIHESEFLIQVKPDTEPDRLLVHLNALKERFRLSIRDVIPEIGLVVVRVPTDLPVRVQPPQLVLNALDPNGQRGFLRAVALNEVLQEIRGEPWVAVAAPNTYMSITELPAPTDGKGPDQFDTVHSWIWPPDSQAGNWGTVRMGFPAAWNFNDAIRRRNPQIQKSGIHVGILDSGFHSHSDLVYQHSGVTVQQASDHGMHVAGIVSATWNNKTGIDGCTPFAKLTTATMQHIPFAGTTSPQISFIITDVISNCVKFLQEHADVRVVNLSLGYNWVDNEGVDPNTDKKIQQIVRDHGVIMRTIAELAKERNIILVSAAGNDSRPGLLPAPVEAQWASPFNWAALNPGFFDTPAKNIIVVESVGKRLASGNDPSSRFSNVHGCVAAPGENILSLVATTNPFDNHNVTKTLSDKLYATMSGTSMAAPHVTGLIAQMYAYNPDLSHVDVLKILDVYDNNRPAQTTPAPIANAFDALVACRSDSLNDLADLNNDGMVDTRDFEIFRQHFRQISGNGGQVDLNRDGQVDANENVFPRSDLNGDGELSRDGRRMIKGKMLTDLGVMKEAWQDTQVNKKDLDSLLLQ